MIFVPYRGIYFLYVRTSGEHTAVSSLFSSPIGESTFSTKIENAVAWAEQIFSSPIGESTFSTQKQNGFLQRKQPFSSPIGESTFSTITRGFDEEDRWLIFVPYRGIYFLYLERRKTIGCIYTDFRPLSGNLLSLPMKALDLEKLYTIFVPYRGIYFLYPASRTPLFIRVPELFCGAKFKNCFSFSISYACAAFSLILCGAAQNSFYCRENSILPIPISYNFP